MLGLTLRSGDKTSLQLVLFSLALFHGLSFFSKFVFFRLIKKQFIHLVSIWFLKTSDTKMKSMASLILHLGCLLINAHFYRSIIRSVSSSRSHNQLKTYFHSILSFPTSIDSTGHDSS